MSEIDDGGAAFPGMASDGHRDYRPGLTKRDYFAAAALPAVIQMCNLDNRQASESDERMFARKALACADALIAASKPEGLSMAESKMPAKVWLRVCGGGTRFPGHQGYVTVTGDSIEAEGRTAYIRADLVEPLVEALRASQAALAMMTAPKSIMATSTAQAYAHAYAAECEARAALSSYEAGQ